MSQQSRQAPAYSSSSINPEATHEPKGSVGRPRNDHGAPTETRTDPLWWQSQPVGMIQTHFQTGDGENLILNFLPKKGHLPND